MKAAIAYRWRPPHVVAECADFVRVVDTNDGCFAALAGGGDGPFSTGWPPGSRLILDLLEEGWRAASGGAGARLMQAFRHAQLRFLVEAPALLGEPMGDPMDGPFASLLAVTTEPGRMHAAWIGRDRVQLVRDGRVMAETTPHTLRLRHAEENPESAIDLAQIPNAVMRAITTAPGSVDPPSSATFEVRAGDRLVLLSNNAFTGPELSLEVALRAVDAGGGLADLAQHLALCAFEQEQSTSAAAAVLQIDAST